MRTTETSSKAKHGVATARKSVPHVKPRPRVDANYTAAKKAGLPASVARALASRRVAVVTFSSQDDPLAQLASGEAKTGAARAGAAFVVVSVDRDGGAVQSLTRLLGALPASPTTLVYTRPAALVTTLTGFNDRTVVEQAAASATTYNPVPAQ